MSKWVIGGNAANAEVEPEAPRNYYDESLGCPPAGPYLVNVKRFHKGETGKNAQNPGEPKIVLLVEIAEPPRTKKARYNGYGIWSHQYVVRDDNAGRINQLLKALLGSTNLTAAKQKAVLKAFWSNQIVVDDKTGRITKIGTWVLPEDITIGASTRKEKNLAGDDALTISSVMPAGDMPARKEEVAEDIDPDEDDEDDEDAEDVEEDDDEAEEEDDEEAEEDEEAEGFDEEARLAELIEMGRSALLKLYKELTGDTKTKSKSDEDLANAIVDAEVAALEEGDEEETEEEEAEEEEAEEEEPEPPAKPARRAAAAKPAPKARAAATRRKGKAATDDDEPPF